MDEHVFDGWTRRLGRGVSRRGTLRTVVGIGLAGAATRLAVRGAIACTNREGAACDPTFGCCEDSGLACDEDGVCQVAGSNACERVNQTNECINTGSQCGQAGIEGNRCKKNRKRKRGRKSPQ